MERGDLQPVRPHRPRMKDQVARRVAAFEDNPPVAEGVVPLNPGFFKLQRMRSQRPAKTHE